jgi:Caspase domain
MVKVALLIGVSEYEFESNPLPGAIKDVEAMRLVLENPHIGDFTEVGELINPDLIEMQKAIEALFANRRKDDFLLLYFSGRGVKDRNDKLFFANRITSEDMLKSTSVPAGFVQDLMLNSVSRKQVIILDCSYSGAFAKGLDVSMSGWVVLTSCTANQNSLEQSESGLSTYTNYLVEGLETGAADRDNNGEISIDELHEYARKKVQQSFPVMKPQIFAGEEGYKILIARASIENLKIRYRKEVEYYASRGTISLVNRRLLEVLRDGLGIVEQEADEIEAEVLKPYQSYIEKIQQYRNKLSEKSKERYPLDEQAILELNQFQQTWGLRDEDIDPIREEIYSEMKEKYEDRLRQYEQIFIEATQRSYPCSDEDNNGLQFLRQIWKLGQGDIEEIEIKITTKIEQQYREKLEQYEKMFLEAIQIESSLSQISRNKLSSFQKVLGLRDEDVTSVEAKLISQILEEQNTDSSATQGVTYDLRGAIVGNLAHIVKANQSNTQNQ